MICSAVAPDETPREGGTTLDRLQKDACDLDTAEALVDASTKQFLEALEAYQAYDGERIVESFLAPFKGRSAQTQATQREAEDAIRQFTATCAPLAQKVHLGRLQLQGTVLGISTFVISRGLDVFNVSPAPTTTRDGEANSLTRNVLAWNRNVSERHERFEQDVVWARTAACQAAKDVQKINVLATRVVTLHCITLRVFKKEHVGRSFRDLVKSIGDEQYGDAGLQVLKGMGERLWAVTKELATIIAEKEPTVEILGILKRLGKAAIGEVTVDTSPGGTETLNELVSQLHREAELLRDVDNAYKEATSQFDKITAVIQHH